MEADDEDLFGMPEMEEVPDIEQPGFEEFFGIDNTPKEAQERKGDDRISKPVLQRLAKARLISRRAKQLEDGAPPTIRLSKEERRQLGPLGIAKRELEQRKIPIKIVRKFIDGSFEVWTIDEFIYISE